MSKTIDEKVVEMRFNNSQFEMGVQKTLDSLRKLKESLDLKRASKGLGDLSSAAKKCDMSGLGNGVETVTAKFSALQVVGMTALSNITNSAVNAGKRMVSALTIDPVKDGFGEYELKMGSIQTIMASTGASLQTVNKYLGDLNEYSDQTIYSFSDMTASIGKFTNAGVSLDMAVSAIKGVSNVAAVSGANAAEASRAMYNFAQALSAGYVKLIDWKSIENANMATVEFKQQLIDTAVAVGTLTKVTGGYKTKAGTVISPTKNFNDSLQDQWMTTDVLTKTLDRYADSTTKIGKKATQAATEVKTFTQLFDTLKESAGSGWATTWEIIVGDFEQSKKLMTGLNNVLGGVIGGMNDVRNNYLAEGLSTTPWKMLTKEIINSGVTLKDFKTTVKEVAKSHGIDVDALIKKHGSFAASLKEGWLSSDIFSETMSKFGKSGKEATKVFDDVNTKLADLEGVARRTLNGEFGKGTERIKALTKAGYKWTEVSTVMKMINNGQAVSIENMSAAQLRNIGLTNEQIATLRDLGSQAEESGSYINGLVDDLGQMDGRSMLLESFAKIWENLTKIINTFKEAWSEVFPETEKTENGLYKIIEGFHDIIAGWELTEETLVNMKDTFLGLANAVWLVANIFSKGAAGLYKILTIGMKLFGFADIWSFLGWVGSLITGLTDWIRKNNALAKSFKEMFEAFKTFIDSCIKRFIEWFNEFKQLEVVQKAIEGFTKAVNKLREIFGNLFTGIGSSFSTFLEKLSALDELTLENVVKVFKEFVKDIKQNFITFIQDFSKLKDTIVKKLGELADELEKSDNIFAVLLVTLLRLGKWFADFGGIISDFITKLATLDELTFANVVAAIKEFGKNLLGHFGEFPDVFDHLIEKLGAFGSAASEKLGVAQSVFGGFVDKIVSFAKKIREAITGFFDENISFAEIATVGVGVAMVATFLALSKALGGLMDSVKTLFGISDTFAEGIGKVAGAFETFAKNDALRAKAEAIRNVAIAVGILAASFWLLAQLEWKQIAKGLVAMLGAVGILVGVCFALSKMEKMELTITTSATSILALAGALAILVIALKIMDTLDGKVWRNIAMLGLMLAALVGALVVLSKFAPSMFSGALAMNGLAVALLIMVRAFKSLGDADLGKSKESMVVLMGMLAALAGVSHLAKGSAGGIITLLGVVIALKVMIGLLDDIAAINFDAIKDNLASFVTIFGMFAVLMAASSMAGRYAMRAGVAISMMSGALILIVVAVRMLAGLNKGDLEKAISAVSKVMTVFGIVVALSVFAGKHAAKAGIMIASMAAAMMVLAVAIAIMSFIDPSGLKRAVQAIGTLMLIFGAIIALTSVANLKECEKSILNMAIVFGVLVAAIAVLSFIKPEKLVASVAAMSILMGMFALIVYSTKFATDAKFTLILMAVVLGGLAGIFLMLSDLKTDGLLATATAMSTVLIALSASMVIVSKAGALGKSAALGLVIMLVVIGGLVGVFLAMDALNLKASMENALAISAVLLAMSGALVICSLVGTVAGAAVAGIGALLIAITALAAFVTAVGALSEGFPSIKKFLGEGIDLLTQLASGIGSIIGSFVGGLTESMCSGLPGIAKSMSTFMTDIQPFLDGVKTVNKDVLSSTKALAEMVLVFTAADFINGLAKFVTGGSSLAEFGPQIAMFGPQLKMFADSVKDVDGKNIKNAAQAAKALADMASNVPNQGGLAAWFAGENSLAAFGDEMVLFGENLSKYSESVTGVKSKSIKASADAANSLVDMAAQVPNEGGLAAWFAGENSLAAFGGQMVTFGMSLAAYSKAVANVKAEPIKNASAAAKSLVAMSNDIPNEGGLAAWFAGENSLAAFSGQMLTFGVNLTAYSKAVANINPEAVKNATVAAKSLVAMSNSIPNEGGLAAWFAGDNSIAAYGDKLKLFGDAFVAYSNSMANVDPTIVNSTTAAAKSIVSLSNSIPKEGLLPDKKLERFGSDLKSFGKSFADYANTLSGAEGVDGAVASTAALIAACTNMKNVDPASVENLSTAFGNMSKDAVVKFAEGFNDPENKVGTAVKGLVQKAISGFSTAVTNSTANFGASANLLVTSFSTAINNHKGSVTKGFNSVLTAGVNVIKTKQSEFKTAGENIVSKIVTGFKSKMNAFKDEAKKLADSGKDGVREKYDSFKTAGKYLGDGLVEGINAKQRAAYLAGLALGKKSAQGVEDGAEEASPSKRAIRAGKYLGEGLVIGINAMAGAAYSAGKSMGADASDGLARALDPVKNLSNLDIDSRPTIRPVLDLTDVRDGASRIGSMLGGKSVSLGASISSAVDRASNIGTGYSDNEVVNAINRLRGDISGMSKTENNVNFNGAVFNDDSRIGRLALNLFYEIARKEAMG